jgi:hypothetical protein
MGDRKVKSGGRKGFLRGRRQAEPYYRDLEVALGQAGCPVCRLLADSADRYLSGVLWEMVLDRIVRAEINEARGYCQQHAWLLDRVGAALGAAILTRGILKTLLDELASHSIGGSAESLRNSLRRSLGKKQASGAVAGLTAALEPQRACPLCTHLEDLEKHITATLVAHLEGPEGLAGLYRDSDGLCQVHFRQALASVPSASAGRTLAEAQAAIWQRLYDELGEFIRKKDFQHKGEAFGPERDSWRRALAALSGPPPRTRDQGP